MLAVFDVDAGVFLDRFMVCLKCKPRLHFESFENYNIVEADPRVAKVKILSKLV